VKAQTGATVQAEEYCANVIAPIRLFDELIRLGLGNTATYQTARQKAWAWLMTYPIANNVWANYFEDVGALPNSLNNVNQYNPGQTARYLLEHPELDPNWLSHVTSLLGYVETTFGGTDSGEPGLQYGARVISEQMVYKYKMASHTARFAANNALLFALTGDLNAKEKAYRSLNWCSYMCRTDGVVIEGPVEFAQNAPCWFTDGHGDYIRHFMLALGAVPEWSPAGQNHIVRSTSVIKSVTYATNSISYTTFDVGATETLRIAFTPGAVTVNSVLLPPVADLSQPGWVFTASNGVLRIRHDTGTSVQILAQAPGIQPPAITTGALPTGIVNATYAVSLTASGGTAPLIWSVAGGSLPAGLTLNANSGTITGTPAIAGTFSFTLRLSDAGSPVQTTTKAFSILIYPVLTSVTVSPTNPSITNGTAQQFTATGIYSDGTAQNISTAVTWTSSSSAVATISPSGLAAGLSAGVTIISAALAGNSGSSILTVQTAPLAIVTSSLPNGMVGVAYPATLVASGGTTPYVWSLASGVLPAGLTLNPNNGAITGTPTAVGTNSFILQVSDAGNPIRIATRALSIVTLAPVVGTGIVGNTNEGTATDYLWSNGAWVNAGRFQAASSIMVSLLRAKVTAIPGRYKAAIYADSSSRPGKLLVSSAEVSNAGNGWQSFPLPSSLALTNGQYYWLAIWSDDAGARVYYSGNNGNLRWGRYDYGAWPDPVSTSGGGTLNYCLYATGTGTTLTSITVTPANPSISVGGTQPFTATGTYSDGSTQNVTSQAAWVSSSPTILTIGTGGLASGITAGGATVTATLNSRIGSAAVMVSAGALAITTTALANGTVGAGYTATLVGSGGTKPYVWSLASGTLPTGLALNSSSGVVSGTPTVAGTSSFTVRVSDAGNPVQTLTRSLSIAIATTPVAATTLWPATAVPALVDGGADSSVELGVKFRSDVAGMITAIRFYKSSANTGTHVGNLWTSAGTRLATGTFTGETASGWQQMNFATPVAISANTVYVASYHANNGHYSANLDYFSAAGVDSPPLHALRNGVSGGNGVYRYGTGSVFPNQTWKTANYWVDVVFKASP
jgi:hypothetical protein